MYFRLSPGILTALDEPASGPSHSGSAPQREVSRTRPSRRSGCPGPWPGFIWIALERSKPDPGGEIGLRIDQTLTQDATGTLVMLELEAMGLDRVRTEISVQ